MDRFLIFAYQSKKTSARKSAKRVRAHQVLSPIDRDDRSDLYTVIEHYLKFRKHLASLLVKFNVGPGSLLVPQFNTDALLKMGR